MLQNHFSVISLLYHIASKNLAILSGKFGILPAAAEDATLFVLYLYSPLVPCLFTFFTSQGRDHLFVHGSRVPNGQVLIHECGS